jgi:hypothetical protein
VLARKDIDARDALLPHESECAAKWTLKQVQGDEDGLGLEVVSGTARNVASKESRHAELVSASIVPRARRAMK